MSRRRRSLVGPLVGLLVACLLPLAVGGATGLVDGRGPGDEVETAAGGRGGGSGGREPVRHPGDGTSSTTAPPVTAPVPTAAGPAPTAAPTTAPPPPTIATPAPAPPPPPATTASTAPPAPPPTEQVVALVNQARAAAGCEPVRVDEALTAAAQGHSDDMAANDYFSHTSLDGREWADRIEAAGYEGLPGGENIARGQRTAQQVHDSWMASDDHRRNIESCDFTAIGVGLDTDAWTWTQDFGF